jgi:hypothetical protein
MQMSHLLLAGQLSFSSSDSVMSSRHEFVDNDSWHTPKRQLRCVYTAALQAHKFLEVAQATQ